MVKSKLTTRARTLLRAGEFAAVGAASVILLVFLASSMAGLLIREGQGAAVVTAVLVDLANTDRANNSVGELRVSPVLTAIAQAKANDMAEKGYFAHTSPEGKTPWYWVTQGGYKFSHAGENLAIDFSDSADVEKAWMNSPKHRANLLNDNFTEIGIATAVGTYQGRKTTFVVQVFGNPAKSTASAPVTEVTPAAEPTEIAIATTIEKPKPVAPAVQEPEATTTLALSEPQVPQEVLGTSAEGLETPQPQLAAPAGLTSLWNVFAASPETTLRYAYYLFGFLILIALVIETGIEIRRHHMKHVFIAGGLILLMTGLFVTADLLVFTDPIIVDAGVSLEAA